MSINKASLVIVIALGLALAVLPGCSSSPDELPTRTPLIPDGPAPTVRIIPTLYPTVTTPPTARPTLTKPPVPTEPPSTPINFDQTVVDLRYSIPSISLDRQIIGNVASRIEIIDQNTGESVEIPDQPGILLELQQVLDQVTLEEIPDDCTGCVSLEYQLPISDKSGAGWLQDVQLLASLENYTTVHLSSHFPPGTILGLRQSATPYQVAQTIALTADDQLWRWAATDDEVNVAPTDALAELLNDIPGQETLESITQPNIVSCPMGPGMKTLYLAPGDEAFLHDFSCPELTLAASLVPIYMNLAQLAELFAEPISDTGTLEPESLISLESIIDYRQPDGSQTTVYRDGLAIINMAEGITHTVTLTGSLVVSASSELIESNLLQFGVEGLLTGEEAHKLFVRGPFGVYSLSWLDNEIGGVENIIQILDVLNARLESLFSDLEVAPTEPTPVPTATQEPE